MAHILVVDDEVNIRKVVREYAEFEGYEVTEAENGIGEGGISVKSEDLLYAIGELDSDAVSRAGEKLEGNSTRPVRLRAVRVLLAAAALLFALGGIGWYVYHSAMSAHIPDDGGRTVFRAVSFADAAFFYALFTFCRISYGIFRGTPDKV